MLVRLSFLTALVVVSVELSLLFEKRVYHPKLPDISIVVFLRGPGKSPRFIFQ